MENTLNFMASIPMTAPPMVFRNPARPSLTQFADRLDDASIRILYAISDLAPKTYASINLGTLGDALEYASVMALVYARYSQINLLTDHQSSDWVAVASDDSQSTTAMRIHSIEEEFLAAAYNAAAACLQAATIIYARRALEGSLVSVMRLTLTAQNILYQIYCRRLDIDAVSARMVSLQSTLEPASIPIHLDKVHLNLLASVTHAQLSELQIEHLQQQRLQQQQQYEETEEEATTISLRLSGMYTHVKLVYDSCYETLRDIDSKTRFSVVPQLLERLVAYKRHSAGIGAALFFYQQSNNTKIIGAACTLASRYGEEARKSMNKTKSILGTDANLFKDPLVHLRSAMVTDLDSAHNEMETILSTTTVNETDIASVSAEINQLPIIVGHMLGEDTSWTPTTFPTRLIAIAMQCRNSLCPNQPPKVQPSDIVTLFDRLMSVSSPPVPATAVRPDTLAQYLPEAQRPLVPIFQCLRRLHILYTLVLEKHRASSEYTTDQMIHTEACRHALTHLIAIVKAILFSTFDIPVEKMVTIGRLIHDHQHTEAIALLDSLHPRPIELVTPYLATLDEIFASLRETLRAN